MPVALQNIRTTYLTKCLFPCSPSCLLSISVSLYSIATIGLKIAWQNERPEKKEFQTIMAKAKTRLVIVSTTSTENSGLFDILIPAYEKSSPCDVSADVAAVATVGALRIAKRGEADVLFVHDGRMPISPRKVGNGTSRQEGETLLLADRENPFKLFRKRNARDAVGCTKSSRTPCSLTLPLRLLRLRFSR
jgi:hypothetical protein